MTTSEAQHGLAKQDLADAPCLIESQFPVSKLSKESYKERKSVGGQTLTAVGKWWGRKPLVLARAAILGLLLPATGDPAKDRETFLQIMTMDDEGLSLRTKSSIPAAEVFRFCTTTERQEAFEVNGDRIAWRKTLDRSERQRFQSVAFRRMSYDDKMKHCVRPEEIPGPSAAAWMAINSHLGTSADNIPDLVRELGVRRFGRTPRVADPFCGGGSIPFEAARIGCDAFASDLSPVAALLTWGALNIVGGREGAAERAQAIQDRILSRVAERVADLGIERGEDGWIADAFLYCNEVVDPSTGWRVPLAGSWLIAQKPLVTAALHPDSLDRSIAIEIREGGAPDIANQARANGTWSDGVISPVDREGNELPPESRSVTPFAELKGRDGLRQWSPDDLVPTVDDVFQERLYCIRWIDPQSGRRRYAAPTPWDDERETAILAFLDEHLARWRDAGFIPAAVVVEGSDNNRPRRARGWTQWSHFFNRRQLLLNGLVAEEAARFHGYEGVVALLTVGRVADYNSRLSRWKSGQGGGIGGGMSTFYSPSLNTPFPNYSCRTVATLGSVISMSPGSAPLAGKVNVELCDARQVSYDADLWITDPGYADMVNYEELSEFFLAWYEKRLPDLFTGWYTDSRRALAVAGKDQEFRRAMVECYRRFTDLMPDNGCQIVMFTHQSADIWADMAMILWASGLRVSQAWTIATETGATGVKQGNYVQGTVLLVLRKRLQEKRGDMADIYPDLQAEVQRQMQTMLDLDPKDDPNFSDSDYQLAAYAAALRVLTEYSAIDEIDVERELYKERIKGERSPLTGIIERAVKIASDYLVPDGLGRGVWRKLSAEERLYMKGVEIESHGEYREGVYQEFARGFGVGEYHSMLGSTTANQTRLKTPSEFKGKDIGGQGFAGSLIRQLLYGIWVTASNDDRDPRPARTYFKQELPDYWDRRSMVIELLRYLADKPRTASPSRIIEEDIEEHASMVHWAKDAEAARLLLGSIENDSI